MGEPHGNAANRNEGVSASTRYSRYFRIPTTNTTIPITTMASGTSGETWPLEAANISIRIDMDKAPSYVMCVVRCKKRVGILHVHNLAWLPTEYTFRHRVIWECVDSSAPPFAATGCSDTRTADESAAEEAGASSRTPKSAPIARGRIRYVEEPKFE